MDLAQHHCDLMRHDDRNTAVERQVLQAAILESRIKERLVRGDLDGAEAYASTLVSRHPAEPRPRLELGQVLVEKGDPAGAAEAYRWAAILGPQVAQVAEFMLGQCLQRMGEAAEARASYLRSVGADPLAVSAVARLRASGLAAEHTQLDQRYDGVLGGGPR